MPKIKRFDHIGITVADLDRVSAFFVGLGFEVEGRTFVEGEFLDIVCGIPDSRTEIVMLRLPDGSIPEAVAACGDRSGTRSLAAADAGPGCAPTGGVTVPPMIAWGPRRLHR